MISVSMLTLVMFCGATGANAIDPKIAAHDGKFLKFAGDTLLMTSVGVGEHSFVVAADAKWTLDGKTCKAADLKPDTRIRVTTSRTEKTVVIQIEALDKNADFASTVHDGKVVSITGDNLVMTDMLGKGEHSMTLTATTKVTCDGKACKATDLQPGMRIRVSLDSKLPKVVTSIEALDKNADFATR